MFGQFRWNPFKTRSLWRDVDYAELIPVACLEALTEPGSARVMVLVPRYRDWLFGRLIQPRLGPEKRYLRVPLEERGSFLWSRLDGKRNVAALAADFGAAFPDDAQDATRRVAMYLHTMYENGFISYMNLSHLHPVIK